MYTDDDIQYALESTNIIVEPDRRIDTFGSTSFEFHLVSELMDTVGHTRVRNGWVHAEKPQIIRPEAYNELNFEGFGEQAEVFGEWLKRNAQNLAFLKYGFNFRQTDVTESVLRDPMQAVIDRIEADIKTAGSSMKALITGVDDTWEISLLRFTVEMINKSSDINVFDFKRRGLL